LNSTSLLDVYATGNVTSTGNYAGGLAGRVDVISTNSSNMYATGNVTSSTPITSVGGLIGWVSRTLPVTYSNCYSTGNVSLPAGSSAAGGLIGNLQPMWEGAITLSHCYATGSVSIAGVTGNTVGGLIGSFSGMGGGSPTANTTYLVQDSFATGAVSGPGNVGGLIGLMSGNFSGGYATNLSLNRSFSTGLVTTTGSPSGGLIGTALGTVSTITNSVWDQTTSGYSTDCGGTSCGTTAETTANMQGTGSTSLYATTLGFDLTNSVVALGTSSGHVWKWTAASGTYPVLDFMFIAPGVWQYTSWSGGNPVFTWQNGYGY
jgi:hypothetical protein